MTNVRRQRHHADTAVGEQPKRLVEPVILQTAGVVSELHDVLSYPRPPLLGIPVVKPARNTAKKPPS